MTKPANFPERVRQRQLGALQRIRPTSKKGKDNGDEIATLRERTASSLRDKKTKKVRTP